MTNFRTLQVWIRSKALAVRICKLVRGFPSDEKFGISSQMRRAAVSVPANIAEGARRGHVAEFAQFLRISLGSLGELETYLEISLELDYLPDISDEAGECAEIGRMLNGLIRKYKNGSISTKENRS